MGNTEWYEADPLKYKCFILDPKLCAGFNFC